MSRERLIEYLNDKTNALNVKEPHKYENVSELDNQEEDDDI